MWFKYKMFPQAEDGLGENMVPWGENEVVKRMWHGEKMLPLGEDGLDGKLFPWEKMCPRGWTLTKLNGFLLARWKA